MRFLNEYLRERFGCKVYKLSLSAAVTCPNRDGTCGSRGCIFCSEGGSGEFASELALPIPEQIRQAKEKVSAKIKNGKYIAYFQSYTNTYVNPHTSFEYLKNAFEQAMEPEDIAVLSIGTRPDCLSEEILDLLGELNRKKPVWVELGLQTIHERTAQYIRRGYSLPVYEDAVRKLKARGIEVITHVIIGLPGETAEDMEATVRYVCASGSDGIKLQLLHVLKGTDLAQEYLAGRVKVLTMEEYIAIIQRLVKIIPDSVVIHRLTGDGDKKLLIAPLWSADKKRVLGELNRVIQR